MVSNKIRTGSVHCSMRLHSAGLWNATVVHCLAAGLLICLASLTGKACAQSFTISFSPTQSQQWFDAGVCEEVGYTVTPSGGFNAATVTATASTSQTGLTAVMDPDTGEFNICATTSVPAGNYPITITGTSGSLTKSATWSPFVFNFTISGSPVAILAGSTGTSTITVVDPPNMSSPTVSLSATGQPSGLTVSFNPATLGANPNPVTSTMNVTVASGTTGGTYPITVTGIMLGGGPTHSTTVNLSVTTPVTTSPGIANTIPIFTGASTMGNSVITQFGSNVGIGTMSPNAPLEVKGSMVVDGNNSLTATQVNMTNWAYNGLVVGNMSSYQYSGISVGGALRSTGGPYNGFLSFNNFGVNAPLYQTSGASIGAVPDDTVSTDLGMSLRFQTLQSGVNVLTERMRITNAGNVGIGTTTPGATLEVNGSEKVDGNVTVAGGGGITFPDGTVQTTAYQGSSPGSDTPPLQVGQTEITVNGGVSADGSGIKHVRTDTSCSNYLYTGNSCTILVDWPGTPFADTNYTAVCTPKSSTYGVAVNILDANKTTTSVNVTVTTLDPPNKGYGVIATGLNCIAIHD